MTAYRPGSGTEGADFMDRFCHRCARETKFRETMDGEDACPIARDTFIHAVDDENYPKQWIEDEAGPRCVEFESEAA